MNSIIFFIIGIALGVIIVTMVFNYSRLDDRIRELEERDKYHRYPSYYNSYKSYSQRKDEDNGRNVKDSER